MARRAAPSELDQYEKTLQKWLAKADIRLPVPPLPGFDGILNWRAPGQTVRYLVEEKRHLRHQDVGVIVDQLHRRRENLPAPHDRDRMLLLAPHIRVQQAAVLEQAEIDYVDLAGNTHLHFPGLFVHVEGRPPRQEKGAGPARPQKGWIKTVMAILIRPDLLNAPYRVLAEAADVALGTTAGTLSDLALRGLLLDRKDGRTLPDRQALVALWVQAYVDALRPKLRERRFDVRDGDTRPVPERLRDAFDREQPWALTGAGGTATEIYAPVRAVEDPGFQDALGAEPVERGGNLLVIEPPGPLAVQAAANRPIPAAPDILTYAELRYRGTRESLEAAERLLPRVLGDHG